MELGADAVSQPIARITIVIRRKLHVGHQTTPATKKKTTDKKIEKVSLKHSITAGILESYIMLKINFTGL